MSEYKNYTNNDLQKRSIDIDEFCKTCVHRSQLEDRSYPCYVCRGSYPSYIKRDTPYNYKEDPQFA